MKPGTGFVVLLAVVPFLLLAPGLTAQEKEPGKQELSGAEHFVARFERHAELSKGAPFELAADDKEALKRVRALKEAWPDHPKVNELYDRVRAALMASKGETIEITPQMLAYRENQRKLTALFAEEAEKQWTDFRAKLEASGTLLGNPFPAPSMRDVTLEEVVGKRVLLPDFTYPTNQFYDMGREFVHVGAGVKGYYFVEIGNREWLGPYEAVKRYRRLVNPKLPEGGTWTLVGRIAGLELMVPDAGKKKIGPAFWGWRVIPEAIHVPGATFAVFVENDERGGRFAGEERLEEIKAPMYTVRSVPDDVTPERLVEIFATAIREQNFELYLDCIEPRHRETPIALSRIRYHWDWHQIRFADFYCNVTVVPGKTAITVLKGFDEADTDEGFFLTEEEKAKIRERAAPLLEEALVWTKAWNEKGVQYGSEKPHFLRRHEKKRWYISTYSDPF
jgi:hypothetical protein